MPVIYDLGTETTNNIVARLGLNSIDELLGSLWTPDELAQYSDDEMKRLARDFGLFAQLAAIAVSAGQASYSLPSDCTAVVQAACNRLVLRPASVGEIESLDAAWLTTAGTPTRWVPAVGVDTITLHPSPLAGGTLDLVYLATAPETGTDMAARGFCQALGDLIEWVSVSEARRRESDAQMSEVAQVLDALADLYRTAIGSYWGGGA